MENCECFKLDMGCSCDPPAPDRPRPFLFPFVNSTTQNILTPTVINFTTTAGVVTGYLIVAAGMNWRIAPTITVATGPTTTATATCTINARGQIVSVTITSGGSGYTSATVTSTITATADNLITFDQLNSQTSLITPVPYKNYPVQRLALSPPSGGGVTLTSAKIEVKLTYTVKTNGITDLTGTFLVNGIPQAAIMTIDDTSAVYTTVTHYSGELTLLYGDYVSYKITSTESKLYDIVWVVGNFTVKYI